MFLEMLRAGLDTAIGAAIYHARPTSTSRKVKTELRSTKPHETTSKFLFRDASCDFVDRFCCS